MKPVSAENTMSKKLQKMAVRKQLKITILQAGSMRKAARITVQ